ncbi:MAG: holo-ACP synthase [Bacillota bacterium]|nr:holo-ACP synthase [Bacillota bacterium]
MIIGVGTDLCRISRMDDLLNDGAFLKRYYDEEEQAYILSRGKMAAASMASHFAAKEAFSKAVGTGFYGIKPRDIGIRHRENGAPYYVLNDTAKMIAEQAGVKHAHLSLSHEGGLAVAFAVLEG